MRQPCWLRSLVMSASEPRAGLVVDQPGANVALDLFVLTERLGVLLGRALEGSGLTASQYAVYGQLLQGPRTPSEVSGVLGIPRSTLSGYLATMQSRGDLTRERSARDGRSWQLSLTGQGRQRVRACQPAVRRAVRAVHGALGSAADVDEVRATLGRIDAAIRAATDSDS